MSAVVSNLVTEDGHPQPLLVSGREGSLLGYGSVTEVDPKTPLPTPNPSEEPDMQNGVLRIEAVARTWSRTGLLIAYLGIFLMAFTTSLEGQVTYSLAAFAVSSFNNHSLLSTVYVVQGVVNGTTPKQTASHPFLPYPICPSLTLSPQPSLNPPWRKSQTSSAVSKPSPSAFSSAS